VHFLRTGQEPQVSPDIPAFPAPSHDFGGTRRSHHSGAARREDVEARVAVV
jgi:hypothetical protein